MKFYSASTPHLDKEKNSILYLVMEPLYLKSLSVNTESTCDSYHTFLTIFSVTVLYGHCTFPVVFYKAMITVW